MCIIVATLPLLHFCLPSSRGKRSCISTSAALPVLLYLQKSLLQTSQLRVTFFFLLQDCRNCAFSSTWSKPSLPHSQESTDFLFNYTL